MKPRLLLVSRGWYRVPLDDATARKLGHLDQHFDWRVLAGGEGSEDGGRLRLVRRFSVRPLDGVAFHLALPFRVASELRRFRPDAVVVQGIHEGVSVLLGRALARVPAKVVLDVQGDWRAATRLYGSPARRLLDPLTAPLARLAVRRSDSVRTVSRSTTELVRSLGVEPAGVFPSYVDVAAFAERPPAPLPEQPQALFVGALERVKNVDGLAEAWRLAAPRVPAARLRLVGTGSLAPLVRELADEQGGRVSWTERLTSREVGDTLDDSWLLVLPSRSEGLPRVAIEALCRGRAVVGSRAGGIPDVVEDGVNGLLVDPEDPAGLGDALARILSDRELADRLGRTARESAEPWIRSAEEWAARLREVVG